MRLRRLRAARGALGRSDEHVLEIRRGRLDARVDAGFLQVLRDRIPGVVAIARQHAQVRADLRERDDSGETGQRSLRLARAMMVDTASFPTIGSVTKAARELRDWQPDFAR